MQQSISPEMYVQVVQARFPDVHREVVLVCQNALLHAEVARLKGDAANEPVVAEDATSDNVTALPPKE